LTDSNRVFDDPEMPLHDVQFITRDGATLYVHRLVLSACFDTWKAHFKAKMRDSMASVIRLEDVGAPALRTLLAYAYNTHASGVLEDPPNPANCDKGTRGDAIRLGWKWLCTPRLSECIAEGIRNECADASDVLDLLCDASLQHSKVYESTRSVLEKYLVDEVTESAGATSCRQDPVHVALSRIVPKINESSATELNHIRLLTTRMLLTHPKIRAYARAILATIDPADWDITSDVFRRTFMCSSKCKCASFRLSTNDDDRFNPLFELVGGDDDDDYFCPSLRTVDTFIWDVPNESDLPQIDGKNYKDAVFEHVVKPAVKALQELEKEATVDETADTHAKYRHALIDRLKRTTWDPAAIAELDK
jgi:hypothetical protein